METESQLVGLAQELCNEKGRRKFQKYLDQGDLQKAKVLLLGALDALVIESNIPTDEAREKYETIGFSPEQASRIRQRAAHPLFF